MPNKLIKRFKHISRLLKPLACLCLCAIFIPYPSVIRAQTADAWPHTYVSIRTIAEEAGFCVTNTQRNYFLHAEDGTLLHFFANRPYAVFFYANRTRRIISFANDATPIWHANHIYMNPYALAPVLGLVYITPRFHPIDYGAEARFLHNQYIFASLDGNPFIFGQNNHPVRDMHVGARGNLSGHGCGPVAVYNALLYLHQNHPTQQPPCIASIIRFLDYNGGINLSGVAGTHPEVLNAYLQRAGHPTNLTLTPTDLDAHIRETTVSILLYGRIRGGAFVHYVKIRHDAGRFWVYNEFGNDTQPRVYDSLDVWVAERGYRVVALIVL